MCQSDIADTKGMILAEDSDRITKLMSAAHKRVRIYFGYLMGIRAPLNAEQTGNSSVIDGRYDVI